MAEKQKAKIFDTRRECLLAFAGSESGKMFAACVTVVDPGCSEKDQMLYGIASTEHQFKAALVDTVATVDQVSRSKLTQLLAEELSE